MYDQDPAEARRATERQMAYEARIRAEERARIVAWLRSIHGKGGVVDWLADQLENGAAGETN